MKASTMIMALVASVASAQVVQNCTVTSILPATYTVTDLTVSTYCPVCDVAKAKGDVYTTVYATTLVAVCPTGLSSSVYTVTNVCTGTTPINSATVPPGFTTTAVVCTACPGTATVTVTVPVAGPTKAVVTGAASSVASNAAVATVSAAATSPLKTYTGAAPSLAISGMAIGMGSIFLGMLML